MDFAGMKRRALQALCKRHGLPAGGTNAALVARLDAALSGAAGAEEEEDVVGVAAKKGCLKRSVGDAGEAKKVTFAVEESRGRGKCHDAGSTDSAADDGFSAEAGANVTVRRSRRNSLTAAEAEEVEAAVTVGRKRKLRSQEIAEDVAVCAQVVVSSRVTRRSSLSGTTVLLPPAVEKKRGRGKAADTMLDNEKDLFEEKNPEAHVRRSMRKSIVPVKDIKGAGEESQNAKGEDAAKQPAVKEPVRRSTRKSVVSVMHEKEEKDLIAEKNPEAHVRRSKRKSVVPAKDIEGVGEDIQNSKGADVQKQLVVKQPVRRSSRKSALPDMLENESGFLVAETNAEAHVRGSTRKSVLPNMLNKENPDHSKMARNENFEIGKCEDEKQQKVKEPVRRSRRSVATVMLEEQNKGLHEGKMTTIPMRRSTRKSVALNVVEKERTDHTEEVGSEQLGVGATKLKVTDQLTDGAVAVVASGNELQDKPLMGEEVCKESCSRNVENTAVEVDGGNKSSTSVSPGFCVGSDCGLEDEDVQPTGFDADKKLDVDQDVAEEEVVAEEKSYDEHVASKTDLNTKLNGELTGLDMESDCGIAEKNVRLVADNPDEEEATIQVLQGYVQEATPECKHECGLPEETVLHSKENKGRVTNSEEAACKGEGSKKPAHSDDLKASSGKTDVKGPATPGYKHEGALSEEAVRTMKKYAGTCSSNPRELLMDLQALFSKENIEESDSQDGLAFAESPGDESIDVKQQVEVHLGSNLSQFESTHLLDGLIGCSKTEVLHQGHKDGCSEDREEQVASGPCANDIVEAAAARYIESGVVLLPSEETSNLKDGQLNPKKESAIVMESGLNCSKDVTNTSDNGSVVDIVGQRTPSGSGLPEDYRTDHNLQQEFLDGCSVESSLQGSTISSKKIVSGVAGNLV
uniref:SAP domain-containing protein n=1 Tax=Setaria italica TaxID=4555 RepID=K3YEU3_SETIT